MLLYEHRLAYCELLLRLIDRFHIWRLGPTDWDRLWDLCDRFERCIALIYPPTLVWEGDYA